MGDEIERKFLVEDPPTWLGGCEAERIEQGYLARDHEVEVRIRRVGDSPVLTIKSGHGLSRGETEIALTDEQFEALWPLTEARRLTKTRYRFRQDDSGTFEIDVYDDALDGLVTAEMEFESEQASRELSPPDWVADEVTGDERYSNYALATDGAPGGDRQ